jgi:hypothetical protein
MLSLGILMMGIFLYEYLNPSAIKKPFFHRDNLNPSSCKNVELHLKKHVPANWELTCENENLSVLIRKDNWNKKEVPKLDKLKTLLYRDLANNLKSISDLAPNESLGHIIIIKIEMKHSRMDIAAITEGKFLAQLTNLKTPEFIRDHLKSTVNIKEFVK